MAQAPDFMDFTKILKDFDPTKFADQFSGMLKNFKLPGVDVDALVAGQRKNVEALTAANRVAFEGVQAFARRQAEMLQETMNETTKAFDAISKAGSPPEAAAKQVEITKNELWVRGERALAPGLKHARVHRLEIPHGQFERRVELPPGSYELNKRMLVNGCLFLSLGKLD